jgi:hypothetical protein
MSIAIASNPLSTSDPSKRRRVFVQDGHIFSSLTSDYLPDLPLPLLDPDNTDCPMWKHCLKPLWMDKRYFSLAYTPLRPRFDKPFDVLQLPKNVSVEEIRREGGIAWYRTPQKLCDDWTHLENELLYMSSVLTKKLNLYGLEFRHVPNPETRGYRRLHKSPRYSRRAIYESRDTFVVLMTWLSYLTTMFDATLVAAGAQSPDFRAWEQILCDAGVPQDRVQALKHSEITDFSPSNPRAGVFVKYEDWIFHRTMKSCIKYNIPVWVYWGKQPWCPEAAVLDHCPTPQECDAAWAAYKTKQAAIQAKNDADIEAAREMAARAEDAERQAAEAAINVPKFPTPHSDSRQKYGELAAAFLERMRESRMRHMTQETPINKQRREGREQAQASHPVPGKGSGAPSVFHWEEDPETGVRMRTRVSRGAVGQFWSSYSNKQRVYDWFHNEWDVCSEFDPETKYPDGEDDDDDDFDDFYMGNTNDVPLRILSASESPMNTMHTTRPAPLVERQPTPPPIATSDNMEVSWQVTFHAGLLDLLYERYGFLNPGSTNNTVYTSDNGWHVTRRILGLSNDSDITRALLAHDDNLPHDHVRQAISFFLQCLLLPNHAMPAALHNLHPESDQPIQPNSRLRILQRKVVWGDDAGPDTNSEEVYFVLSPNSPDGLRVMLRDAATVLECYRRFDKLADVLDFLFMVGSPFHTFLPHDSITLPQPFRVQQSPTLGVYPQAYAPGLREYLFYEQRRKEFCSQPRARAALTRGGIIWRLALECIGAPGQEIVVNGPSREVFTHGTSLHDLQSSGTMRDDTLTEAEMDLMCGVYIVYTGEHF